MQEVWLIDDDEVLHFIAKELWSKLDIEKQLITYPEAKNALVELIKRQKDKALPSSILVDINMPDMDGWEFLELAKSLVGEDVPIHILSSSTLQTDKEKAIALGAQSFIEKPLTIEKLQTVIS